MVKKPSKRAMQWILAGVGVAIVAFIGVRFWIKQKNALPEGIASGNGRIEAKLVDVAAKEPLRVKEILVDEGDLVKPGQVLVRLDTVTLESELAEANAGVAGRRGEAGGRQGRRSSSSKSEIDLAEHRGRRVRSSWSSEGAGSQRELDVRTTKLETTKAGLAEAAGDAGRPPRRRSRSRRPTPRRSRPASTTRP